MLIKANNKPITKSKTGEKFAICVLAFAVKSVTKFNGNSIIVECTTDCSTLSMAKLTHTHNEMP